MKRFVWRKGGFGPVCFFSVLLALLLASCASVDPAKVDVELKETKPVEKITSYSDALRQLGLMTEVYATGMVKIQSNPIGDNTGTSGSTGGEIPRDITEMIKSSLNSIGGSVLFIPYDPAFIQNQMVTGYSNFDQKLIPDVVISGGITEFDRGLVTRGKGTDAGAEADFTGLPDWLPSQTAGIEYSDADKVGLARITLDFNLLDFQTMSGIPRMNTTNSMEVSKAMADKELGITLFGLNFGRKGSVKKVQGRHAAVRLLVEVSMIQIVGKHLALPYWRLLGDDALPDPVVIEQVQRTYYSLGPADQVAFAQEWLFLHGYNIPVSGVLDAPTIAAFQQFDPGFDPQSGGVSLEMFTRAYTSIPLAPSTLGRRQLLAQIQSGQLALESQPAPVPSQPQPTYAPEPAPAAEPEPMASAPPAQPQYAEMPAPQAPAPRASAPAPQKRQATASSPKKGQIGRVLSEDEW
jgi:hypothetical protein